MTTCERCDNPNAFCLCDRIEQFSIVDSLVTIEKELVYIACKRDKTQDDLERYNQLDNCRKALDCILRD